MVKEKDQPTHVEVVNNAGETVRVYNKKQGENFAEKAAEFAKKNGYHVK